MFNEMVKPEEQQISGSAESHIAVEGLSLEEKARLRATGKVAPVKKEKSEEHGAGVWNTCIQQERMEERRKERMEERMGERRKEVSTIPVGWGNLGGETRKRCAGASTWSNIKNRRRGC